VYNVARITCYLVGTESLLVQCAEMLLEREHEVLGIISAAPIICRWADDHGVSRFELDGRLPAVLGARPFDYLFSITNLELLSRDIIDMPRRLAVNFHDGPLPRYAGLHATTWALLAGEQEYAVTWHRIGGGVDKGDILIQEPVPIAPDADTALTLNTKCYEAGMRSFARLLDDLETDRSVPRPQDLSRRSYFGRNRRPSGAGSITWDQPSETIAVLTRALDFGHAPNPLALPKAWNGAAVLTLRGIEILAHASGLPPGTVVEAQPHRVVVATGSFDVAFTSVGDADGLIGAEQALVSPGARFGTATAADTARWTTLHEELAPHESFWVERLSQASPLEAPDAAALPALAGGEEPASLKVEVDAAGLAALQHRLDGTAPAETLVAAVATFLARTAAVDTFDLAFSDAALVERTAGVTELFSPILPLRVSVDRAGSFDIAASAVIEELRTLRTRKTYPRDVVGRYPALRKAGLRAVPRTWPIQLAIGPLPPGGQARAPLHVSVDPAGRSLLWERHGTVVSFWTLSSLARQFEQFLQAAALDGAQRLQDVPLLGESERQRVLVEWNRTAQDYDRGRCVHQLFEAQVARTPSLPALVFERDTIDYAALNGRANRVARRLRGLGVGPDVVVGLATDRSIDMVVCALGILKAGGAYLPLDPAYPRERLRLIIEDARVPIVLTHQRAAALLPSTGAHLLVVDSEDERRELSSLSDDNLPDVATAADLAYVIYTSGSTGEPKGVMVEHRNVANFLIAMDGCLRHDPPGVWLAVTSLSFDISVLELFWTLARGFKVVLHGDARDAISTGSRSAVSRRPLQMSLSYFASDEGQRGGQKYKLLLEGAKFADTHGFTAVWTPERHFHAFGGLYPNPSVISAALATVTSRISIRAGSVVLPLHHPLRVAEEWSVVDNLSGGRVGVSFASGWHPDDFVLRPEAFADAKRRMLSDIEIVRRLWRGERVPFPGPLGEPVATATMPRPVQPVLPVWITAAGNPDTFKAAGHAGAFVLTHLLGQTLSELAEKIAVYRQAWRAGNHGPGGGHVTLMLHTFVGESESAVRTLVRAPMKAYLRSSISLIKHYAWSFPAAKKATADPHAATDDPFAQLSPSDLDALVEHAFDRYFDSGGLFGTPASCLPMIEQIKAIGIEEIACLIDFGVDDEMVLRNLEHLNELREMVSSPEAPADDDYSIAAEIERHEVTHFQCTPSLAGMLVRDAGSRLALAPLEHMAVGGEALSPVLAEQLRAAVGGTVTNMYGPTETTVWSATAVVGAEPGAVPIGQPVANTQIYVLDVAMQPVPPGFPGEIYIGGDGVARGYLRRPDLSADRFVRDPFAPGADARLYRTGDLGSHRANGQLEFLGRIDHQVKIRGHRVELGEVEASLMRHPSVQDAVVIDLEGPGGGRRVAAYMTARPGAAVSVADVRAFVSDRLPEYMVPSHFLVLAVLPQTPNGKIDRKALPAPQAASDAMPVFAGEPHSDLEQLVAGIWQDVLHTPRVDLDQNFFDLGGHSLLTMQVLARLRDATGRQLPISDMFRFPTVRELAAFLSGGEKALVQSAAGGADRGASRREMLLKRRKPVRA
jgi:natural product biosynthesis luciferase-like monooxygenase protein